MFSRHLDLPRNIQQLHFMCEAKRTSQKSEGKQSWAPLKADERHGGSKPQQREKDMKHLIRALPDQWILNFGKHKGKALHAVAREDQGYLRWMTDVGQNFSAMEIRLVQDHLADLA